jgi:hypothetical protein
MPTRRPAEITTTPDTPPPLLNCPMCDRPLLYEHTVVSGLVPRERWDLFRCLLHGQIRVSVPNTTPEVRAALDDPATKQSPRLK